MSRNKINWIIIWNNNEKLIIMKIIICNKIKM